MENRLLAYSLNPCTQDVKKNTSLVMLIIKYRQQGRTTQVMGSRALYFSEFTVVPKATLVSLVQQIKELERDLFLCLKTRLSEDLSFLVHTSKLFFKLKLST